MAGLCKGHGAPLRSPDGAAAEDSSHVSTREGAEPFDPADVGDFAPWSHRRTIAFLGLTCGGVWVSALFGLTGIWR